MNGKWRVTVLVVEELDTTGGQRADTQERMERSALDVLKTLR